MTSRRHIAVKLLILLGATALVLGGLELVVRMFCRADADGEVWFRSTRLRPFRLPIKRTEEQLGRYLSSQTSALIYDAELGWTQRPEVANHNAAGFISTAPAHELHAATERVRIALFGDSFTQGNYRTGWWRVLEEQLRASGISADVLNFGVGGYGMDQAYLRWKRDGLPWRPQVVIFGFFAEDCYRNLNTFRLLRDPDSGIPFFKPRFVLTGDELRLENSPTPPPNRVLEMLSVFPDLPLARHEWFYRPGDFEMKAWRRSRLAALAESKALLAQQSSQADDFFRLDGGASRIALRLMRKMRQEVEASGGRFVIAHLPGETELAAFRRAARMPHQELYEAMRGEHEVIDLQTPLSSRATGKNLRHFFRDGHYTEEFEMVVGTTVADALKD